MAVQQETIIGDEDLDALMAELEVETAGMVAAPVIKATAAIVIEDDSLDGLNDDPVIELDPTDPRDEGVVDLNTDEHLNKSIAAANVGSTAPDATLDDEMAALEAELAETKTTAVAAAPSMSDKIAAKAAALAKEFPSDVPKTTPNAALKKAQERLAANPSPDPEGDAALADMVVKNAEGNLDAELAAIAATIPPKNPNPPAPAAVPGVTSGGALAGLGYEMDIDQFRRDISVTETNLDNCMMEQAGLIAWYIAQHAGAEAQASRTKVQVEMGEAKLYAQHRAALSSTTEKVTEKLVENAVRMDPKYGAIQNRLIEAETRAAIWKGCVEGLKQRRDMIIQLGADRREDGKGAVRIMAAEQSHADMKAAAVAAARR